MGVVSLNPASWPGSWIPVRSVGSQQDWFKFHDQHSVLKSLNGCWKKEEHVYRNVKKQISVSRHIKSGKNQLKSHFNELSIWVSLWFWELYWFYSFFFYQGLAIQRSVEYIEDIRDLLRASLGKLLFQDHKVQTQ